MKLMSNVIVLVAWAILIAACGGGGGGTPADGGGTTDNFTLGGTLTGLASGASVTLQNNGGDDLSLTADGGFSFATALTDGSAYSAAVLTQPTSPEQSSSCRWQPHSMYDFIGTHREFVTVRRKRLNVAKVRIGLQRTHCCRCIRAVNLRTPPPGISLCQYARLSYVPSPALWPQLRCKFPVELLTSPVENGRCSDFIKRRVLSRPISKPCWRRFFIIMRLPRLPREAANSSFMRRLSASSSGAISLPG